MLMSRTQNAGQNHIKNIANRSFETMAKFRYLATAVANQNWINDEINSRFIPGNTCYCSVKKLLSPRLLPKNLTIKIYKILILPVSLYCCETWSLTSGEGYRLRLFEKRC
jgi:hypothetical protein